MIKNKTIILVCKETFSFPFYFLGKELEKNNEVHYFFITHTESIIKNQFNKKSYFYFKRKIDHKYIHDTSELAVKFIENRKNINYMKIPYISQDHSRYKSYNLPCFNIGREMDEYFIDAYNKNRSQGDIDLKKYTKEVEDYRAQSNIMPEIDKNHVTSSYNYSFKELVKRILVKTFIFIKQLYKSKDSEYKIPFNTPLFNNIFKRYLSSISYPVKKFYLYSKFNKLFKIPEDEKYIYLPLHMLPESSTFTKVPMHVNEANLVEAISKSLPISWKLYVKEHQAMVGRRKMEFYKKIKKFHNVKIVKSNFYKDPKPWIENSLGVVTITGTTAFEASMLNKPAIVFGNVFYNVIPGIKVATCFEDLENLLKIIETDKWPKDNTLDCAAYIKTVKEIGTNFNIKSLNSLSEKKIELEFLETAEHNKLTDMINNLMMFFENAKNIYDNSKKK